MAAAITDAHVVSVLKLVVRGSGPVLDALTETDPLGWKQRTHRAAEDDADLELGGGDRNVVLKVKDAAVRTATETFYSTEFPGTAAWEEMGVRARSDWWVDRVGRLTTFVVAAPGVGGVLAERLPVQDTLGAASQALVLCAVARVHGVTDQVEQVRLLAHVLTGREVTRTLVEGTEEHEDAGEDPVQEPREGRSAVVTAGRALWRFATVLRGIAGELGKRPQGGMTARLVGMLPVVGVAGDYVSERSGMKTAVTMAETWIGEQGVAAG